jgi:heparanase
MARAAAATLAAVLSAAAAAPSTAADAAACVPLAVNTTSAVNTVAPYYTSWNIDPSRDRLFFDTDWTDARLKYLASRVGGARIRFGGTGADALYYGVDSDSPPCGPTVPAVYECLNATWWGALAALSTGIESPLVFGLNIHPPGTTSPPKGPWNATNARALLTAAKTAGVPLAGLELGNEQNDNMSAAQQAAAFAVLAGVLDDVFGPPGTPSRPMLAGPDTHSFRAAGSGNAATLKYLTDFTAAAGKVLGAVTHHEYIEIDATSCTDPSFLDNTAKIGAQAVAAVRKASSSVEVWAGEIGPHNGGTTPNPNCAGNHVCGRWGSTLWYADALGAKATAGYAAFCRQDLVGADYALLNTTGGAVVPSTDYWLLAVWKAAVGASLRTVLAVAPPAASPAGSVRAYAFCGAAGGPSPPTAALLLINIGSAPACVGLPPSFVPPGGGGEVYTLTPGGDGTVTTGTAVLNGVPLAVQADGTLPPLTGAPLPAGSSSVTLPPLSVTLVVTPLAAGSAPACEAV